MGSADKRVGLLIGLDLDNTLISYGDLFYDIAVEKGWISEACGRDKLSVRTSLLEQNRNDLWTELQGLVYGPCLDRAAPFPGVSAFLSRCKECGVPAWIISHKTHYSAAGPRYDLHASASRWLRSSGLIAGAAGGVSKQRIVFCETRSAKLGTIGRIGFTHFIDDLPEVFLEPDFPAGVEKILFDPENSSGPSSSFRLAASWSEVENMIFCRQ